MATRQAPKVEEAVTQVDEPVKDVQQETPPSVVSAEQPTEPQKPSEESLLWYRCVHGGPMIDPSTGLKYVGEVPKRSIRTGWLEMQIEAGKMEETDPI